MGTSIASPAVRTTRAAGTTLSVSAVRTLVRRITMRLVTVVLLMALVLLVTVVLVMRAVVTVMVRPMAMVMGVFVVVMAVIVVMRLYARREQRREPELDADVPFRAGGDACQAEGQDDRGGAEDEGVAHGGVLHRAR